MKMFHLSQLTVEDIIESIRDSKYTPHDENGDLSKRFKDIKSAWEHKLPRIVKQYEKDGDMRIDPYFYDWTRVFSPIERMAWSDIRYWGAPLYPQFPTNGYFLDFANPMMKIALECDGAAYHDKAKDLKRDERLINDGWIVIRVTGRECNLHIDAPFHVEPDTDYQERNQALENWFMNSSEGVIYALKKIVFPAHEGEVKYYDQCVQSINLHLSEAHNFADINNLLLRRKML